MATVHGEVVEVRRLTPNMVRVVVGGPGLDDYVPTEWTDQYVNVLFDRDGQRTVGRRYTIRSWDPAARRVTIDFVVHGDVGVAGRWASRAAVGDPVRFDGPSGGYRPAPDAAAHLLVGDESALPAIAASLERLPAGRRAVAVLVVDGPEHELVLDCPGDLELHWVHRGTGDLLDTVAALDLPAEGVDVFVHGEAAEVRAVRRHLLGDRGIPKAGSSISPYWRRGHTDEAWREVKRDWLVAQEQDV